MPIVHMCSYADFIPVLAEWRSHKVGYALFSSKYFQPTGKLRIADSRVLFDLRPRIREWTPSPAPSWHRVLSFVHNLIEIIMLLLKNTYFASPRNDIVRHDDIVFFIL